MIETIAAMQSRRAADRTCTHDPLPLGAARGDRGHGADVTVDSAAARLEVDLSDNPDCLPCGAEPERGTSRTAAMVGVFNSLAAVVPPNAGSFRRVEVRAARELHRRHPASSDVDCSVATTNLADRVDQRGAARRWPRSSGGSAWPRAGRHPAGLGRRFGGATRAMAARSFINELILAGGTGGPGTSSRRLAHARRHRRRRTCRSATASRSTSCASRSGSSSRRIVPDSEGAGTLSRRARHADGVPPRRLRHRDRLRERRHRQPGAGRARRTAGHSSAPVPARRFRRTDAARHQRAGRHPQRRAAWFPTPTAAAVSAIRRGAIPRRSPRTSAKAGFRPRARHRSTRLLSTRGAGSTPPPRPPCGRNRGVCGQATSFWPWYLRSGRTWSTTFCRSFS